VAKKRKGYADLGTRQKAVAGLDGWDEVGVPYIAPDFLGHRFGVEEGVQRRSEAC